MAAESDKVLAVVESVIFYHAEPESGTSKFVGSKERVRIGIRDSHKILSVFLRYVTSFCGIKEERIKRGHGESLDVRICRLVKDGINQPKAFPINTQDQWYLELPILTLTLKSVQMIYNQLNRLDGKLKSTNKDIHIDLHVCLTTQVENLHVVGHFKDQCPTSLNYSRNLGNTVYESIKRITSWAAYYFTHPTSYYPIPDSSTPLKDISKLSHLGKTEHLKFYPRADHNRMGSSAWQVRSTENCEARNKEVQGWHFAFEYVSSSRFCLPKGQDLP